MKKILNKKSILLSSLILVLALFGFSSGPLPEKLDPIAPDTVYFNGNVITMDEGEAIVEAVAVKDGKIIAVGTNKDVRQLTGSKTKEVNLKNHTMLPGFIDAHSHPPGAGTAELFQANLNAPPVGEVEDIDDLVAELESHKEDSAYGDWIHGRGYDQTLLKEQRHPTKEDLDRVSKDRPVWIGHSNGHMGVANSKALELAGIDKNTEDPEGGEIVRDKDGEPTGFLKENAQQLVMNLLPSLTDEQKDQAMERTMELYTAAGVTTANDAFGFSMKELEKLRAEGKLPIRFIKRHSGELPTFAQEAGILPGFGDEWLKLGAYGEDPYDGSIQGYSGYLQEPYYKFLDGVDYDEDYVGYPNYSKEELFNRVKGLYKDGYNIAIHANGDQAIEDLLDAYEAAQKEFGEKEDVILQVGHAQMTTEDQLVRMKELGVTPSFYVSHTYFWGDQHRGIFQGPERAAHISPLKSATDLGIRYSIHLDTPVTPMEPLQAVWSGVNRLTRSGEVLGPEQRVDPMTALKAVTIDAAWQNNGDDIKGSIETGKLADFVILQEDPLTIDPVEIKNIKVLETIVDGKTVYENEATDEDEDDTAGFPDVKQYEKEINFLANKGIIKGYENGNFGPNDHVLRVHAVNMILKEMGIDYETYDAKDPGYADVKKDAEIYDAVAAATDLGFIKGKTNSKGQKVFDPYGKLTREQMAIVMVKAYNLQGTSENKFTDVSENNSAKSYIDTLVANDIAKGYEDGTFRPFKNIERKHFSVFLYKYLTK